MIAYRFRKPALALSLLVGMAFNSIPTFASSASTTQMFLSTGTGPVANYSDISGDTVYNRVEVTHELDRNGIKVHGNMQSQLTTSNFTNGIYYDTWDSTATYTASGESKGIQNGIVVYDEPHFDGSL